MSFCHPFKNTSMCSPCRRIEHLPVLDLPNSPIFTRTPPQYRFSDSASSGTPYSSDFEPETPENIFEPRFHPISPFSLPTPLNQGHLLKVMPEPDVESEDEAMASCPSVCRTPLVPRSPTLSPPPSPFPSYEMEACMGQSKLVEDPLTLNEGEIEAIFDPPSSRIVCECGEVCQGEDTKDEMRNEDAREVANCLVNEIIQEVVDELARKEEEVKEEEDEDVKDEKEVLEVIIEKNEFVPRPSRLSVWKSYLGK